MTQALIVIDIQNDYFPDGAFPLWDPERVVAATEAAVARARSRGVAVVVVQHVAKPSKGSAPFFQQGTPGAEVHPKILAAAQGAPVVVKHYADSFVETELDAVLTRLGVTELFVCGMMTQNCVTHTAISKQAEKYRVSVLTDCCTTVSEPLHLLALNALSTRLGLVPSTEAF